MRGNVSNRGSITCCLRCIASCSNFSTCSCMRVVSFKRSFALYSASARASSRSLVPDDDAVDRPPLLTTRCNRLLAKFRVEDETNQCKIGNESHHWYDQPSYESLRPSNESPSLGVELSFFSLISAQPTSCSCEMTGSQTGVQHNHL